MNAIVAMFTTLHFYENEVNFYNIVPFNWLTKYPPNYKLYRKLKSRIKIFEHKKKLTKNLNHDIIVMEKYG